MKDSEFPVLSIIASYNPGDGFNTESRFYLIPPGTQFKTRGGVFYTKTGEYTASSNGDDGYRFNPPEMIFIKLATVEPERKSLAKNNPLIFVPPPVYQKTGKSLHSIISFDICESLPYDAKAGIIGLFGLIKIQLENRLQAGDYPFDEIKNYAFQKIDAITSELGWIFGNWSIFITSFPGNPPKKIPGRISIGFTDENQGDAPEMCSITVQFPIGV